MSYTASYIVNSSSAQGTTDFQFTFPYIKEEHIEVFLNYNKITQGSGSAQYQVITNVSPKLIRLNTGIASANLRVEVRRNSSLGSPLVDYADGSTLTANDLDTSSLQSLYIDQELKDNQGKTVSVDEATGLPSMGESSAGNLRLTKVADPTAAQDAATKNYVDTKVFTSAQIQDGTLVNADVNTSAAIDGTKISPNFGSQNIVTSGTVDGRDVSNDGIKLDSIETGATADQTNAEIRAAVEAASDSNVFTDADHSKLNAIEAGATADQTNAEIRTAVEAATDSNVFTDADHSKLNAIEANATADQTNAEIRAAVEAATDSNVFTDADHSKLNAIEASATADQSASEIKTLLQSDKLTSSEIATGALDGRYYTETESDARYFNVSTGDTIKDGDAFPDNDTTIATTAAINDRIIDLVDDVGGFVPIANETSFPNANPDVNNGTGTIVSIGSLAGNLTSNGSGVITIANGTVGNSTVTINGAANSTTYSAGYGLLVETTSTLNTYTFHRLSSKATEVSTVAGNISNINAVANNATNINSAVSNASNINSAVSNASNINSAVSNASNITTVAGNNTNINTVAGANSNITTVAGSISNVNTVGGSIANVNTVATNISNVNDFSDKYRVASSAPSSNNDTGDLYFDTSSNELRVYNGSSWQGGVTATGNLAGLGANTFTGNQSLGDNLKVQLGTGNDLQIFHDGTSSKIQNSTGQIWLINESSTANSHIRIRPANGNVVLDNPTSGEYMAIFKKDGSNELYYDNAKKLETTSYGTLFTGNSKWVDNGKATFGTSDDLQLFHDGTHNFLQTTGADIIIYGTSEDLAKFKDDGAVELYYDGSKKAETVAAGFLISGELVTSQNSYSRITHQESGASKWSCGLRANGDDDYHIYREGGSGNVVIDNGNFSVSDNQKAMFGASDDLQIYHSGGASLIDHVGTGILFIRGNGTDSVRIRAKSDENGMILNPNGNVELMYDGTKKLETTNGGASITGDLAFPTTNRLYFGNSDVAWVKGEHGSNGYLEFGVNTTQMTIHRNGTINIPDNNKFTCGASNDLQIWHNGSNSFIEESGPGALYVDSNHIIFRKYNTAEVLSQFVGDGAVELYYDNSKKLETNSGGVNVTGALTVNGSALSSAPQITATTDGALTAGDAVIVKSNGEVTKAAPSFNFLSPYTTPDATGVQIGAHDVEDCQVIYDEALSTSLSKLIFWIIYRNQSQGDQVWVGSYNATDNSFDSSPSNALGSGVPYGNDYDSDNNKLLLTWRDGSGNIDVASFTTSGISSFSNNSNVQMCANFSGNEEAWYDIAYVGSSKAIWVGPTSTTAAAAKVVSIASDGTLTANSDQTVSVSSTRHRYMRVAGSGNEIVVAYSKDNESDHGYCRVGTISGTSISFGSETEFANERCDEIRIGYDSVNDKYLFFYGYSPGKVRVGTVSGTSISFGTAVNVSTGNISDGSDKGFGSMKYNVKTGTFTIAYLDTSYGRRIQTRDAKISGTSVTLNARLDTSQYTTNKGFDVAVGHLSDTVFGSFLAYRYNTGRMRGQELVTMSLGTNLTTENFIGFASAGYSDNATATIDVAGATNSNQSSLTAGQKYFVQNNGSLGLTAASPKVFAGTAVSATKLIVNDQAPPASVVWEILGTTNFSSSNGNYSENTGWTTDYQTVKCIFSYLARNPTNSSHVPCNLSMRWYFNSSYGANGTLNTQNEYKYGNRYRGMAASSEGGQNGDNTRWRLRNGAGVLYWSGEITFRIAPTIPTRKIQKYAFGTIESETTLSTDSCYHDDNTMQEQVIVGARLYEDGGNNFEQGRVTWYGLKHA